MDTLRQIETPKPRFNQQKHPELLEGEMWISNSLPDRVEKIKYKSVRVGETAFDTSGIVAKGLIPVFISIEEYQQRKREN